MKESCINKSRNLYISTRETKIGYITIVADESGLKNLFFSSDRSVFMVKNNENEILKMAFYELDQYLDGNLREFSVPINPDGTVFQKLVWSTVRQIGYGERMSYKEVAIKIHRPSAPRAIGNANNKNPIPIFIPCHRVIGINGSLVGYKGDLNIKRFLIELEQSNLNYTSAKAI